MIQMSIYSNPQLKDNFLAFIGLPQHNPSIQVGYIILNLLRVSSIVICRVEQIHYCLYIFTVIANRN